MDMAGAARGRWFAVLAAAVVATACDHPSPVKPSAGAGTVDVLEFVIGDAAAWPRFGTQSQHQTVDEAAREVCWVKYGRAEMFECWRWDDRWIYHSVDHAIDGDTGESYRFTDGRWLPRFLAPGSDWSADITDNRIQWFSRDCQMMDRGERAGMPRTGAFPYALRAHLEAARDLGGDLGTREVLVLEYGPHAPGVTPTQWERFSFARGAGWFEWQCTRGAALFNRIGGTPVARALPCGG